jgi:hypothetical protein
MDEIGMRYTKALNIRIDTTFVTHLEYVMI